MAVEAQESTTRQIVPVTWDREIVTGEVVQLFCVNPENGDVSNSGLSKNDGQGYVTYPEGYSGTTEVTVYDNDGNADFGVITVGDTGEIVPPDTEEPPEAEHPIELPPEGIEGTPHPEHPIVWPPAGGYNPPTHGSEGPTPHGDDQ